MSSSLQVFQIRFQKPLVFIFIYLGLGGSTTPNKDPSIQWSIPLWAKTFEESIQELAKHYVEANKEGRLLVWDKDDDAAMQFVAACSNIRAHIFHIGTKPLFDIKGFLKYFRW